MTFAHDPNPFVLPILLQMLKNGRYRMKELIILPGRGLHPLTP